MHLRFTDGSSIEAKLIVDEASNKLILQSEKDSTQLLVVDIPFKIAKIHPEFKDFSNKREDVLVFRNRYHSQYDVCEVRLGSDKQRLGFLFNPFLLFEEDNDYLYKDDKHLQTAIFRAIGFLMLEEASLVSKKLDPQKTEYSLSDMYPDDIVVGVFPHDWSNGSFNFPELLLNLYLYGFYYMSNEKDFEFKPANNEFQKQKLSSIKFHTSSFRLFLDTNKVDQLVVSNEYFKHYIQYLTKSDDSPITQFYQLYGLVEIFKDEVLKKELVDKVNANLITATGYKIQQLVREIANDSYCVNKLFTKYSDVSTSIIDATHYHTLVFLEKYREKDETDSLRAISNIVYFLRNILVHDIQFVFRENIDSVSNVKDELKSINTMIEYVILNTLQTATFTN